jgi:hypothetical protein
MGSVVMEKVKVRQLGERVLLAGKVVESQQGDSLKGKTVWQNMDQVMQIIECENVDEAKKTLKTLPGAGGGGIAVPLGPADLPKSKRADTDPLPPN